jgi:SagB-type dehydrogenase family enzyme
MLSPLKFPLDDILATRVSVRNFDPCSLSLENLATLLHYAYGVTRDNQGTLFPRPLRIVPSGGALYPLEIFFHTIHVTGLDVGLYHYNPAMNNLRLLCNEDSTHKIADAMVYPNLAVNASVIFFITAIFDRSVFKYGNRVYRFILLEGGHVAQNVNLVANALGLGSVNIGGYFDREIDDLLGLDGITQSTIYMGALGKLSKNE